MIINDRLMGNIYDDIQQRLSRKKRGYTIDEVMSGVEIVDSTQLSLFKECFPDIYKIVVKEENEEK